MSRRGASWGYLCKTLTGDPEAAWTLPQLGCGRSPSDHGAKFPDALIHPPKLRLKQHWYCRYCLSPMCANAYNYSDKKERFFVVGNPPNGPSRQDLVASC